MPAAQLVHCFILIISVSVFIFADDKKKCPLTTEEDRVFDDCEDKHCVVFGDNQHYSFQCAKNGDPNDVCDGSAKEVWLTAKSWTVNGKKMNNLSCFEAKEKAADVIVDMYTKLLNKKEPCTTMTSSDCPTTTTISACSPCPKLCPCPTPCPTVASTTTIPTTTTTEATTTKMTTMEPTTTTEKTTTMETTTMEKTSTEKKTTTPKRTTSTTTTTTAATRPAEEPPVSGAQCSPCAAGQSSGPLCPSESPWVWAAMLLPLLALFLVDVWLLIGFYRGVWWFAAGPDPEQETPLNVYDLRLKWTEDKGQRAFLQADSSDSEETADESKKEKKTGNEPTETTLFGDDNNNDNYAGLKLSQWEENAAEREEGEMITQPTTENSTADEPQCTTSAEPAQDNKQQQ